MSDPVNQVDIVIPIYNALEDVKHCVASILANSEGFDIQLILVNDASDIDTTEYLRELSTREPCVNLIQSESNQGYSISSNLGLERSSAAYVVLMNSDIIVTRDWLEKMLHCAQSASNIGIVSPVTNAAIWQSVPHIPDSSLVSTVNFPNIDEIEHFSTQVEELSCKAYPELPYIHGYCQFIKREVLDAIGVIDAESYTNGMGSELDFCFRAADAGFKSVVADDTFIYHSKAKSLNKDNRAKSNWYHLFVTKYGKERCQSGAAKVENCLALDALRDATSFEIYRKPLKRSTIDFPYSMAFLIDQLTDDYTFNFFLDSVLAWRKRGIPVHFIVPEALIVHIHRRYANRPETHELWISYQEQGQLLDHLRFYDVIFSSDTVHTDILETINSSSPDILPVLLADKLNQHSIGIEKISNFLLVTHSQNDACRLSAETGKRVHALENLCATRCRMNMAEKLMSFWFSEKQRYDQQQRKALLSLMQDAVLYHRKNQPLVTFSKGIPQLDQMISFEEFIITYDH